MRMKRSIFSILLCLNLPNEAYGSKSKKNNKSQKSAKSIEDTDGVMGEVRQELRDELQGHFQDMMHSTAKRLGLDHTQAFELLQEKIENEEVVEVMSEFEVVQKVASVVSGLCPLGDLICDSRAYEVAFEAFFGREEDGLTKQDLADFESDINSDVMDAMRNTTDVVHSLTGIDNEGRVLEKLDGIMESLENVETKEEVEDVFASIAMSVVSIAQESTRLWTEVSLDSESALNKMSRVNTCSSTYTRRRRRRRKRKVRARRALRGRSLQLGFEEYYDFERSNTTTTDEEKGLYFDFDDTENLFSFNVEADVQGAIRGAIKYFGGSVRAWDLIRVTTNPGPLFQSIVQESIAASAAFATTGLM